jgi:hypothetical protein
MVIQFLFMLVTLIMMAQSRKLLYVLSIMIYCLSLAILIVKMSLFIFYQSIKVTLEVEELL